MEAEGEAPQLDASDCIISLGFGPYANRVLAHSMNLWHADLLAGNRCVFPFHRAHTELDSAPVPRAILFDVRGSYGPLGGLRKRAASAASAAARSVAATWAGSAAVHAAAPPEHAWAWAWTHDVAAPMAEDAVVGLSSHYAGDHVWQSWADGADLMRARADVRDAVDDAFHRAVERCDRVSGFNVVAQLDGGWGGFAAHVVQWLRDDMERTCIVTTTTSGPNAAHHSAPTPHTRDDEGAWQGNYALAMDSLATHSTALIATSSAGAPWQPRHRLGNEGALLLPRGAGAPLSTAHVRREAAALALTLHGVSRAWCTHERMAGAVAALGCGASSNVVFAHLAGLRRGAVGALRDALQRVPPTRAHELDAGTWSAGMGLRPGAAAERNPLCTQVVVQGWAPGAPVPQPTDGARGVPGRPGSGGRRSLDGVRHVQPMMLQWLAQGHAATAASVYCVDGGPRPRPDVFPVPGAEGDPQPYPGTWVRVQGDVRVGQCLQWLAQSKHVTKVCGDEEDAHDVHQRLWHRADQYETSGDVVAEE